MAIKFQPRIGAVVRCDFKGMIEPEMGSSQKTENKAR